ncbi:hypothetical protein GF420_00145 [candidate division GN15 bacterium]|nr:hypothetical protein [candidate division GN15 bacterium]
MLSFRTRLILVTAFAVAMAYFEAAVVVYLREIYYPEGFGLPLKDMAGSIIGIELFREASTLAMLALVGVMLGRAAWERFAFFLIVFGIWDIFYYVFLKATINWPSSLLEWDILFLLPLPWIGPVIAPVLVSVAMITAGLLIARLYPRGKRFHAPALTWLLAIVGSGIILYSFMSDTAATLQQQMPQPYAYWQLALGLLCYAVAVWYAFRRLD